MVHGPASQDMAPEEAAALLAQLESELKAREATLQVGFTWHALGQSASGSEHGSRYS
jgi:hypothetical protein